MRTAGFLAFVLSLVLSLTVFLQPGQAVMVGLSTEELTKGSELVVQGRVLGVSSHWSADGSTIVTSATVTISRTMKGKALGREIEVEYEGGEAGGMRLMVSDTPVLKAGEDVLLFLNKAKSKRHGTDVYAIFASGQGKYSVSPDGTASKEGFSLAAGHGKVDNNIHVDALRTKIKKARDE